MRVWLRNLMIGGAVGLVIGLVVGGVLGRIFMRLVFLAREDTLGFETAMGAIIGDFTAGGTLFIGIFGAFMGAGLGLAYVVVRGLLPAPLWWREVAFMAGSSALMVGVIVRDNREDFYVPPGHCQPAPDRRVGGPDCRAGAGRHRAIRSVTR